MEDISLHILDIVENSFDAEATSVVIIIDEDEKNDLLTVEIRDNGRGMDEEQIKRIGDPFFTTKAQRGRRVGLGLALLKQSAEEVEGSMTVKSQKGIGTEIKATFRYSHIDRKPIGNIMETLTSIIAIHPEASIIFRHTINGETSQFEWRENG